MAPTSSSSNYPQKSKRRITNKQNLYEILGASPTDKPNDIKQHYRSLVKLMHPDTGNTNAYTTEEFTLVTEAYSTLSDPKSRLKYDRSLQARKIAGLMGNILEVGMQGLGVGLKGADTIIRKTADTAEDLAPKLEKVTNDVGERATLTLNRFAVESKIRELEQKATKIESQASKLQTQIENISSKRFPSLSLTSNREPLSSKESNRMLQSFQASSNPKSKSNSNSNEPILSNADQQIVNEITTLTNKEDTYTNTKIDAQLLESQVSTAESDVDKAVEAQTVAQAHLEKATRELAAAKDAVRLKRKSLVEKEGERNRAEEKVRRVMGSLELQMEKVRVKLRRKEESALEKEVLWMEDERDQLEKKANVMWEEVSIFTKKLEEM